MKTMRFFTTTAGPHITLMRHAQSTWNAPRIRVQGQLKDKSICLSEEGRLSVQAKLISETKPDVLISSSLLRCIQTIEAWFGMPQHLIPIPLIINDAFMEINAGTYEGRWLDELQEDPLWRQWMTKPHCFPGFPKGETLNAFAQRILQAISDLTTEYDNRNKHLYIITHSIAMRVVKCVMQDLDFSHLWHLPIENLEKIRLSPQDITKIKRHLTHLYENHPPTIPRAMI
jgi:broad specificity phosphatase PhoE